MNVGHNDVFVAHMQLAVEWWNKINSWALYIEKIIYENTKKKKKSKEKTILEKVSLWQVTKDSSRQKGPLWQIKKKE